MSFNIYKYLQQGIPLYEAIEIIQEILANFSQLTDIEETAFNNKLQTIFDKSEGFQIIFNISEILITEKENVSDLSISEDLTSCDMAYFKFVLISVDI